MATWAKYPKDRVFRAGRRNSSVEEAVDRCAAALVTLDELAAERVDSTEERLALDRSITLEDGQGGFECAQFVVIEVGEVGEMESITDLGEFDDPRMVGADRRIARRPRRTCPLLLAEHGGQFGGCSRGVRSGTPSCALFPHDVEATLRDATHERHDVFFFLQRRTQRAEFTERQRRRVDVRSGCGFVWCGDVRTLEPTGNRREDGDLVARTDRCVALGLVAVAPHAAGRENCGESVAVATACLVE